MNNNAKMNDSAMHYIDVSYEEAMEMATDYLTKPPVLPEYREYHSSMLNEAVRRSPLAQKYVKAMLGQFLDAGPYRVAPYTYEQLINSLFEDMYGLGPIEELIDDPDVQEVNVNGPGNIWYEKHGVKQRAAHLSFQSEDRLRQVIDRCLPTKEVNRLEAFAQSNFDGSRIYVAVPPVAKTPYLNYRKFSVFRADEQAYLENGTLTAEALEVLKLFVRHRANITIIGPQNTGKTTLLSFLTDYYPAEFRIGVLESPEFETDIELRRPQGNVFSLKAEEKLGVTELDIFKHALRFSADVLIIPEARGAEMEEVLKAQRRGNRGSMTTVHSISPANLVDDIMLMIMESGRTYQLNLLRMMVAKALDIVITMHHFPDGSRRVIGISEVDYDDAGETPVITDLFVWENETLVRSGSVLGLELAYNLLFHGADREELRERGLIA